MTDPLFWAERASFLASLARDRRQFTNALQEARFAAALYQQLQDPLGEVRLGWLVASIHEQTGHPRAALASIQQAIEAARYLPNEAVRFSLAHTEVFYLARCRRFAEARIALRLIEGQYAQYPDYESYRLWVVGLIAAGLGLYSDAETAFGEARDSLLRLAYPYDAALVTLDWSLFLLDQNRPEEVLPLAVSMGQAFEALGVARETLASWAIFQAAAERRELTRAVAESMVRTLGEERAGAKPER